MEPAGNFAISNLPRLGEDRLPFHLRWGERNASRTRQYRLVDQRRLRRDPGCEQDEGWREHPQSRIGAVIAGERVKPPACTKMARARERDRTDGGRDHKNRKQGDG